MYLFVRLFVSLFDVSICKINSLFFLWFRTGRALQRWRNIWTNVKKLRTFGQKQENVTPVFMKSLTKITKNFKSGEEIGL